MKPKKARRTRSKVGAALPSKRVPLSLRVTPLMKEKLDGASISSGRSLTQEIELRLEQSFNKQAQILDMLAASYGPQVAALLAVLADTIHFVAAHATTQVHMLGAEKNYGDIHMAMSAGFRRPMLGEAFVFAEAAGAVSKVLELLRPEGDPAPAGTERDFDKLLPIVVGNFLKPLKVDADRVARITELLGDLRLKEPK